MRNIEVLRSYFLGKDPQLKETLADNSLRLIGIPGKEFVVKAELIALKKYVEEQDQELAEALQHAIEAFDVDIEALREDLRTETSQRKGADDILQNNINGVSNRVQTIETWKSNSNFVYLDDLTTALLNYYTKAEVDAIVSAIPTLTYLVVPSLPTTDISTRTIYLVPNGTGTTPDYYDEYLYTGDPQQTYDPTKWELIGTTNIDLSNYYTKAQVDAKMTFTKLTADLVLYDATPLTLTTGWYDTDAYEIIQDGGVDPIAREKTLFYYSADDETIIFLSPATVIANDAILLYAWRNQLEDKWEYEGIFITQTIDSQSTNTQVPSAEAVYNIISSFGDTIGKIDQNTNLWDLDQRLYLVKANTQITYSSVAAATPIQFAYDVYMLVEDVSSSRKNFLIVAGNSAEAIHYGYTYETTPSSYEGSHLTLDLSSISTTAFTGTDGQTAGTIGLVPAPTTSDTGKYLKSDGTWGTVSSGTTDYSNLTNKPSINNVTLSGDKTFADLGITASTTDLTPGTSTLASGTYYFVYE